MPRFKYDKSKVEEYQLALITSLGNMWVVDSTGHLGADELVDLLSSAWVLQQSLLLTTSLWEGAAKIDIAINHGLTLITV